MQTASQAGGSFANEFANRTGDSGTLLHLRPAPLLHCCTLPSCLLPARLLPSCQP